MACIEKLPHSCGSSDGLQVFSANDGFNGYCFACDTFVANPYEDKEPGYKPVIREKTEEEVAADIEAVSTLPIRAFPERKLKKDALEYFGVTTALSEQDGDTPIAYNFPYYRGKDLIGYKVRWANEKRMYAVGTTKDADMFGWHKAIETGGRRLFITEGEFDAIALWQVLKDRNLGTQWESLNPAVVSLPSGASSAQRSVSKVLNDILRLFSEIVLVFDMDEQGQKAAEEVIKILPKAYVAVLPAKDANDCLMEGREKALANAVLFKAAHQKNSRLVKGVTLHELGRHQAKMGLSWPWEAMTRFTRGIRFGETYYIGAGVKMGKSGIVNALAAHLMIEHDLKVLLAKPEETNKKTYLKIAGQIAGKIFDDPNVPFDYEAYDLAKEFIGDKLVLLDVWQHLGWETLRQDIVAAASEGVKAVFIDPITNLTNGVPAAEANTVLQGVAQDLAALAKDLDIVVFIFCHLKAPDAGPPHERGGKVQSYQFAGSRAMMRSCNYMIGLEGNKDPDLPIEERNLRRLVILEDREFGVSNYLRYFFDDKTGLMNELKDETHE